MGKPQQEQPLIHSVEDAALWLEGMVTGARLRKLPFSEMLRGYRAGGAEHQYFAEELTVQSIQVLVRAVIPQMDSGSQWYPCLLRFAETAVPHPDGGCIALWTMNPETEEQEAPARIYGDWQASEYLGDVLAELKPRRKVNLPDFPAIVRAPMADGMDICVYCQSFGCNECIVNEWKSERSDEE